MKLIIAFLLVSVTLAYSQGATGRKCNATRTCPQGQRCFNGRCQNKLTCETVNCVSGSKCLNDPIRCLKPCSGGAKCPVNTVCRNGYCENALTCKTVKCRANNKCREYPIRCLEPCTVNNRCPAGQNCIDAYCEPIRY